MNKVTVNKRVDTINHMTVSERREMRRKKKRQQRSRQMLAKLNNSLQELGIAAATASGKIETGLMYIVGDDGPEVITPMINRPPGAIDWISEETGDNEPD